MLLDDYAEALSSMTGISRLIRPDRGFIGALRDEEDSVTTVSGGLCYNPVGMYQCLSMDHVFIAYCDQDFGFPCEPSMEMVDDRGVVIGCMVDEEAKAHYMDDPDIIWLSSNFVVFPDRIGSVNAAMYLYSQDLEVDGVEDGVVTRVFFPTMGSCELIRRVHGGEDDGTCIAVVGVDGLSGSVPVADVVDMSRAGCGHRESAPEDTLYRGDLVGEPLEVGQPALADEDLHAPVMVQVDVHGCRDHGPVLVLDVGEPVADG